MNAQIDRYSLSKFQSSGLECPRLIDKLRSLELQNLSPDCVAALTFVLNAFFFKIYKKNLPIDNLGYLIIPAWPGSKASDICRDFPSFYEENYSSQGELWATDQNAETLAIVGLEALEAEQLKHKKQQKPNKSRKKK